MSWSIIGELTIRTLSVAFALTTEQASVQRSPAEIYYRTTTSGVKRSSYRIGRNHSMATLPV